MAVMRAGAANSDPVAAVLQLYQDSGRLLLSGKVVDVQRHTSEGFVRGSLRVAARQRCHSSEPTGNLGDALQRKVSGAEQQQQQQPPVASPREGQQGSSSSSNSSGGSSSVELIIEFQNENLVARQGSCIVGCVPDLICCLDSSSGEGIATEDMRYGLWVSVLLLPAHPLLRTPAALEVVGPAAFGYAAHYQPVGPFPALRTVHELYAS
jgi:DUF917 family protein